MENLNKIKQGVNLLLTKYKYLRNPFQRKQLIVEYWKQNNEIGDLAYDLLIKIFPRLTSAETISRCVRKCQEENSELKPLLNQEQKRYEQANIFAKSYGK